MNNIRWRFPFPVDTMLWGTLTVASLPLLPVSYCAECGLLPSVETFSPFYLLPNFSYCFSP